MHPDIICTYNMFVNCKSVKCVYDYVGSLHEEFCAHSEKGQLF